MSDIYRSYIASIYIEYFQYILGICRCHAYPFDIPSLLQIVLFSTIFIMICLWYTKYIHWMYLVYQRHIILKIVRNKPICTRLGYQRGMHDIYIFKQYALYIQGIYMVYTLYLHCNMHFIYPVYTWYIPWYTIYIMCVYSTLLLMLLRRTGCWKTLS